MSSGFELWHNSAVRLFLEEFVLTHFAGAPIVLALTNSIKFDTAQRITGTVVLIFAKYFVMHTTYKRNEKETSPLVGKVRLAMMNSGRFWAVYRRGYESGLAGSTVGDTVKTLRKELGFAQPYDATAGVL